MGRWRRWGGAEAVVHAHLALERLHAKCELRRPLAVVQVDAENCFGRLEWPTIRREMVNEVPELGPVVTWKHHGPSHVEYPDHSGVDDMIGVHSKARLTEVDLILVVGKIFHKNF